MTEILAGMCGKCARAEGQPSSVQNGAGLRQRELYRQVINLSIVTLRQSDGRPGISAREGPTAGIEKTTSSAVMGRPSCQKLGGAGIGIGCAPVADVSLRQVRHYAASLSSRIRPMNQRRRGHCRPRYSAQTGYGY